MALLLEMARWLKWHWVLSDKDFNRVTDLTSLSILIATIYVFNRESIQGLITLINWLPMLFFLLIVALQYSTKGTIKLSSLFWSLRHYEGGVPHHKANLRINLSYPYMMVCLLSASTSNASWFFAGMCVLAAWGLWTVRPQRYPPAIFGALLIVAGTFAYLGQLGLSNLQTHLEELVVNWFEEIWMNKDPYRQRTAIGDIGRLKQSSLIILRVDTPYPILLREASYNIYFKTTWRAKNVNFSGVTSNNNEATWSFNSDELYPAPTQIEPLVFLNVSDGVANPVQPKNVLDGVANPVQQNKWHRIIRNQSVEISAYLHKGKGMLALPHGTYRVSALPVLSVQRNNFGAVKVEKGPGLIRYTAHFDSQNTKLDTLPTSYDLSIPPREKNYLIELSNNLKFPNQTPQQVLSLLTTFFKDFQYTLNLAAPPKNITPLENFLHYRRAGHCEYFATATVLLLRAAGIPSRYATGYAVQEFSDLEDIYVVRQRHAHAWALAYIDGHWQEFDTTPAAWISLEEEMVGWWKPIYDLWYWITYEFYKWRWHNSDNSNDWLIWLILPLSLIFLMRLYSRKKVARFPNKQLAITLAVVGADSAFYQIVQRLNAAGLIVQPGETLTTWLQRIQAAQMSDVDIQILLNLHQRYRFDPIGITVPEQARLTALVKIWLKNNKLNVER